MNKFTIKFLIIFNTLISGLFFSLIFFNQYMMEKVMPEGGSLPPGAGIPPDGGLPPNPPVIIPFLFIFIISSIFVFIILKYIEKNFVNPLETIEKNVEKIKNGSFDVEFQTKSENRAVVETFNTLNQMTEGLNQKEKLQNNFIRNLVHDLRAPIVASERAMDILSGEIDEELYSALKENNSAYLKLVNSVIETITKKEVKIEKINFSLLPLTNTIIQALKFLIQDKNITIKNEIKNDFTVWADYISTNRIILNLLSNSIENNNNNTITIKAKNDTDSTTIIIEDNGKGIKNPDELFKRHIKLNDSSASKPVSGLGLSIVKELTEANNGEIEVQSEENKYTRFIVKLPKEGKYEKN